MNKIRLLRSFISTLLVLIFSPGLALAQLDNIQIAFDPHGFGAVKSSGIPVELTDTSFLVIASGPDEVWGTADDRALVVSDVDSTPLVSSISTPYLISDDSFSSPLVLSATRVLLTGAGVDGLKATGDEVVYLLDGVGDTNTITTIPIGFLDSKTTWKPIRLSSDSAAIVEGAPHTAGTTVKLLTDLGGNNTVTTLAAPFLRETGGQPVALSPTSLLVPMAVNENAAQPGDMVYFFSDLGGTNMRTDISTPNLNFSRPGVPVPISATRAVIASDGLDGIRETSDDGMYLLDGIGGTNSVTFIAVPFLYRRAASGPAVLNPDLVVVASMGPDGEDLTADDQVNLISDIGVSNTVSFVVIQGLGSDRANQPVRLSSTAFVVSTTGGDLREQTADDELVVVTDVGGSNIITRIVIGGLDDGVATQATVINEASVILASGGVDNNFSTADDIVNLITGLPDAPMILSDPIGEYRGRNHSASRPRQLGSSRAMFLSNSSGVVNAENDVINIVDHAEIPDPDRDGDGINNDVDEAPDTSSADFSDAPIGGTTSGTITEPGKVALSVVEEPNPEGVRIRSTQPGTPARVSMCDGASVVRFNTNDEAVLTCGSVHLLVIVADVPMEMDVVVNGEPATVFVPEGSAVTFDPEASTFTTPDTNESSIVVTIDGEETAIGPGVQDSQVVPIEIKPGSRINLIILDDSDSDSDDEKGKGVVPVAILSTNSFDATTVDPFSISLAGAPVRTKRNGSAKAKVKDVNEDGLLDLLVQVEKNQMELEKGARVAMLEAMTTGGQAIVGSDSVRVVTHKKWRR